MRKTYQCLNDTALKYITTQYIHFAEYCHTKQFLEQQKREKNLIIFLSFKKNLILSNNHKLYGHSSLSLRFWYKGFVEDKAKTKSKHQVERKQPKVIELDATVQPKEEIAHE